MSPTPAALPLTLSILCVGCYPGPELELAKARIAQLEKDLAELKAKSASQVSTAASTPQVMVAAITPPATVQVTPSAVEASTSVGQQWTYRSSENRMTGGTTYSASVLSSNTVTFRSPYGGEQYGSLALRTDPKYGKDVIFSIQRGQLLCRSYEDCEILVRFDDGKPEQFAGVGAADNSTEIVFIRNYERFLGKLRKAKIVRISLNIY